MAKSSKKKADFYVEEKPTYDKYKKPIPITENHRKYHNLLKDKSKKIVVCNGWAGSSKAQPLYSKLLTPKGYINMGDVKIGDEVFGEDGKPHKVLGVFPQGKKDVYEITFSDGSKCRCSDEHLWNVTIRNRKNMVITLKELLNMQLNAKLWHKKDGKYYNKWLIDIPITQPLDFAEKEVKIDPYVLGVILSGGSISQSTICISNSEIDIITKVDELLRLDNFSLSVEEDKLTHYIEDDILNKDMSRVNTKKGIFNHRMKQYLYDYDLLGKLPHEKFIPKEYLINSKNIRLSILQGILDADGTVNGNKISIATPSRQLAEDISFLVQSFGGTATIVENNAGYKTNNNYIQYKNSFEVYIKLPIDVIPLTSYKHLKRYNNIRNTTCYRKIRRIDYIGKEECQCILVDNPTHLYLTDNMIVTHNTISSIYYACQAILNNEVKGIVIVKDMRDLDGYLPGDIEAKYIPKVKQLLIYAECFLQCDYKTLLDNKTIIIQPLAYIQGTDYTDYIMIVDEAQLISPELMYCICSRGASRIFINGDTSPMQSTAKHIKQGKDGLSFLLETMKKSNFFGMVTMDVEDDIVRDSYIKEIITNMQPKLEQFKNK